MDSKPLPVPDAVTAPYWAAAAEGRLSLQRCDRCNVLLFPPKPRCPDCLDNALRWTDLSGRGRLYSYCTMHIAFVAGFEAPFMIGVTELAEQPGLHLPTNLVDCAHDEAHIGMEVEITFERRSGDIAVPQFRPLRRAS